MVRIIIILIEGLIRGYQKCGHFHYEQKKTDTDNGVLSGVFEGRKQSGQDEGRNYS